MDWQATTLWPAFRAVFMGLVRTPPEKRDLAAIATAQRETLRVLGALDWQLAKTRFVAGEALTMGDIPIGASIHRCFVLGAERGQLPNVARWYDELQQRAAYRETIMLPLS